jgi:hypothetical protein
VAGRLDRAESSGGGRSFVMVSRDGAHHVSGEIFGAVGTAILAGTLSRDLVCYVRSDPRVVVFSVIDDR